MESTPSPWSPSLYSDNANMANTYSSPFEGFRFSRTSHISGLEVIDITQEFLCYDDMHIGDLRIHCLSRGITLTRFTVRWAILQKVGGTELCHRYAKRLIRQKIRADAVTPNQREEYLPATNDSLARSHSILEPYWFAPRELLRRAINDHALAHYLYNMRQRLIRYIAILRAFDRGWTLIRSHQSV